MIWFVNIYERICKFVIKPKGEDEDEEFQLQFITTGMLSTAELSILQAEKEMEVYARRTRKMFKLVQKLAVAKDEVKFVKLFSRIEKYEGISDRMEIEIGSYLGKVAEGRLGNHSKERIRSILRGVTEIESIADSCHNMARHYKRKAEANSVFTEELRENIRTIWKELEKAYDKMEDVLKLQEVTETDMTDSIKYENRINELRNMLKRKNIEDVNDNLYDYQTGVFYMDLIVECEHMGDYILNVVQSIQHQKY
jgi:phosphate:Na+ symporter